MAIVFAPEPVHELFDPTKKPPEWDKLRVFGYYVAEDMTTETVPHAGGRRFRLPDGRVVEVTRIWCTCTLPMHYEAKWAMHLFPVDEKPPAEAFVADVSDARLVGVHIPPMKWVEDHSEPRGHASPLERIRYVCATAEALVEPRTDPGK